MWGGAHHNISATGTVCLSGACDATTIAGGIALTTADGEVVDVAPGIYDQEVPTELNHTITLRCPDPSLFFLFFFIVFFFTFDQAEIVNYVMVVLILVSPNSDHDNPGWGPRPRTR